MCRVYATDRPRASISAFAAASRRCSRTTAARSSCSTSSSFRMPGTPILYYGDEIGMGDNVYLGDRNGVRTPMQWSPDRNAGFSRANPQQLYLPITIDPEYHYEAVNVDNQQKNLSSLALVDAPRRSRCAKISRPSRAARSSFCFPENAKVLAFLRDLRRRNHPRGGESLALFAGRWSSISRASPVARRWRCSARIIFPHQGCAVSAHARAARAFLVRRCGRRRRSCRMQARRAHARGGPILRRY